MTTRLQQLEQNDSSLNPLLAITDRAELDRIRPRRPVELHPDTRLALILCADGWSLEEIEQHLAARKAPAPRELSSNQRRWLAEAYDAEVVEEAPVQPTDSEA